MRLGIRNVAKGAMRLPKILVLIMAPAAAALAAKGPSWWLRDSLGVPLDDNYSATRPTNCHCRGYTQDAPGPMWDFRQQRVRDFFMSEMVAPMVLANASPLDGIFFDDALDIPNYCLTPPHGSAPCTGNFTFTAADQAAVGAATMEHWDHVLGAMAAKGKGTVMSMNPVTASSYPVNSSAGDGMLQRHGGFHFFEFFCAIGKPANISVRPAPTPPHVIIVVENVHLCGIDVAGTIMW